MRLWARKRVHYWLVQEKLGVGQRRDLCWIGQMKRILQQRIERCIIFTKRIWNMKSYFEHVSVLCFACTTKKDSNWILLWYTGILELDNEEKIVNRWNYFRLIPCLASYVWQGKHYQVANQWTNRVIDSISSWGFGAFVFFSSTDWTQIKEGSMTKLPIQIWTLK